MTFTVTLTRFIAADNVIITTPDVAEFVNALGEPGDDESYEDEEEEVAAY